MLAQHTKIDSLKVVLAHAQRDTDKINTLINIGNAMENINPDSSILLGNRALALSRKISWKNGIVTSQTSLGGYYDIKGALSIALAYEDSALSYSNAYNYEGNKSSIYNELGNITSEQNNYSVGLDYYFKALAIDSLKGQLQAADLYNNIGLNYQEIGEYVTAEQYYLKTEKIYEQVNDKERVANISSNLGLLYYLQLNYQKGLDNNLKALELDSTINNPVRIIPDYLNIGLGYLYLKNYVNALYYTFKSISLGKKIGQLGDIQKAYCNIGEAYLYVYDADSTGKGFTYIQNGNRLHIKHLALLDSAMVYSKKSIQYSKDVNDKLSLVSATRDLGDIYDLRKDYMSAISNYQYAFNIADSLGFLQQKMEFSQALGRTYSKAGDFKMAAKYFSNALNLMDTLFGQEKTKQMAEMEAKYQNEKKEKEIESLSQKNEIKNLLVIGVISFSLLIFVIAFLFFRQTRINTTSAKIELEQKLLRTQMNPHFIFNVMTSIQGYIYEEKPLEAANYISAVFKLMRHIIESSKQEYILLDEEVSTLKYYLALQQICFNNKFDFTIDIEPSIDIRKILIPPMMMQPFIENAIEHGISNKKDTEGIITIRLKAQQDTYSFEIEDNGIGREKAREIGRQKQHEHLSVATNITQERIDLLNRKLKKKISIQIVDLKNTNNEACGTRVVFLFPLNMRA